MAKHHCTTRRIAGTGRWKTLRTIKTPKESYREQVWVNSHVCLDCGVVRSLQEYPQRIQLVPEF